MALVARFTTDAFDVSKERPNPINPIPGESLLWWLRDRAGSNAAVSEPDAEDWGWYCNVEWQGRNYLLGSSACEDDGGALEWILQIVKHRSLKEKLLGRAKMADDDDCAAFFVSILESEGAFEGLSLEWEP